MDTPDPPPPPNDTENEGNTPPEIEAMAERAVADLEAGDEDDAGVHVVNMDTDPPPPGIADAMKTSFETKRPEVVAQTESTLTVTNPGQLGVTIANIPPPPVAMEPLTPVAPPFPVAPAAEAPSTDKSKKGSKRKTARTVRRVLVAKKEMDAATQVMTGLRDISKVLHPEDAKFLGEEYWVFTQHQLAWLVESVNPPKDGDNKMEVEPAKEDSKSAEEKMDVEIEKEVETIPPVDTSRPSDTEKVNDDADKLDWKARRDMLLAKMASALKFESEKVVTAAVQADTGEAKEISIASREDAEKRLGQWEEVLKSIGGSPFQVEEDSFSLDGPMNFLIPKGFKNFLDSIDVKTLYQFLALKKTETGALCELYALWRHTCKLSRVTAPAVVRYFLGIHARLEGAVTSVPPCTEKQRKWMNNTIVVMTGAALEFLVEDRGIFTARDFVDARTKDLSLQLAAWRDKKKLEPLKGSGKVAMISGWKAVAKEIIVMESGDGEVVPNLKLMASSDLYLEEDPRPKRPRTSESGKGGASTPPTRTQPSRTPSTAPKPSSGSGRRTSRGSSSKSDYDMHSKLFLEQVLGIEVTEFLALASIHTAAQLFESDETSDESILQAMVDAEEAKDIQSASVILKAWVQKLKDNLTTPVPSKRKGRPQGKAIRPETLKDATDPYDLMSDVTKKFLATMDIHTAEKFLSTRTTEIAAEFVKFRKKHGMPELKGLGSIASVSGWKANCRRFARAMGREDIASLEPAEKSSTTPKRPVPMKAAIIQSLENPIPSAPMTHPGVLFGKSRRMFAVQGESDVPMQFRFDVSLRNEETGSGIGLYLTYKGSGPSIRPANVGRIPVAGSSKTVPLLVDTTLTKSGDNEVDSRALFASHRTRCGLVDLQKYGVRPLKDQNLSPLKKALQCFFEGSPIGKMHGGTKKYNVALRRSDIDKCQYLAVVGSPMQAGQTMALIFPDIESFLASPPASEVGDFTDRNTLLCSLFLLSKDDLEKVMKYMTEDVLPSVSLQTEDPSVFKKSLQTLQRVDWVSRRLLTQMTEDRGDVKKENATFSFKRLMATQVFTKLSDDAFQDVVNAIKGELLEALLSLTENDSILGKSEKKLWCPLAKELYDEVVGTILSAILKRSGETDYKESLGAVFRRATELSLDSGMFPKLAFSGSPLQDTPVSDELVVVCPAQAGTNEEGTTAEMETKSYAGIPLEDVEKASEKSFYSTSPDVSFYRSYLSKIAVKVVTVFGKILDKSDFDADGVLDYWKLSDNMSPEARALVAAPWNTPVSIPSDPIAVVQPKTEQFFLGIVWPVLREFGWRIEVDNFPTDRVFAAPRWKGDQQKLGKLAKLAKTHRDRRRQNLAREVNQIGFGAISKLTKRLFVASGGLAREGEAVGKPASGRKLMTVRKICDKFLDSIKSLTTVDDPEVMNRAREIIEQVIECFDSLASSIQSTSLERGTASEKYGGDVFMEFLLVLPALLGRSELELQEMNDSLELVHELTHFMTNNHADVFPAGMRPSPEVYMTKGKRVPSTLLARLERKRPGGSNKGASDELTEVLWDEDAEELSDFVTNVMSQTIACRATEADVARKFRRIHVGYPGVVCRHCLGEGGEGRYFFTTIESLTTLSTVFEKHIMKCAYVPADIKKAVVTARSKHAEQRKAYPNGAQQAYFNRLWDRLRSMKIAGTTNSSAVPLAKTNCVGSTAPEEPPNEMTAHPDEKMTFTKSMDVLDFVRTSAPWKGTKEIEEALNQYYNCLDYGGRIFQTKSMPEHFSEAWLLNKVVPRRSRTAIKRHLPG